MPISKFKATCLATLERVRRTGAAVARHAFRKPVADIVPPATAPAAPSWLGAMKGTARIAGDITVPTSTLVRLKGRGFAKLANRYPSSQSPAPPSQ